MTPRSAAEGALVRDRVHEPPIVDRRALPHSLDAEGAVLCAMLLSGDAVRILLAGPLAAEHFLSDANRHIYEAARELASAGRRVDIVVVAARLRDKGDLAKIGGSSYLTELANATPAVAQVETHARILLDRWRVRSGVATHNASAVGVGGDVDAVIDDAATGDQAAPGGAGALVLGASPVDVDDLFAPLAPAGFLSEDLRWCPGRPATIVGAAGCGKTLAIQSAALSIAAGRPLIWERFPVRRQARVLHLDHGNGRRATLRRYQRLAFGMGLRPDDLRDFWRFVPSPNVRLTDSRARDAYRRAVEGWDLCILDSLRGFTTGVDEDARLRDCFEQVLAPVSEDTGCSFVVLHDEGKAGAQSLEGGADCSSSAIFDGSGSQLRFALAGRELRRVTMAKAGPDTAGKDLDPFYLEFVDVPDTEAVDLKAGVRVVYREEQPPTSPRANPVYEEALRYVRKQTAAAEPVHGAQELAKGIRVRHSAASAALKQLEDQNLVVNEREPVGHGPPKPRYWACSASDFTRPPRATARTGDAR